MLAVAFTSILHVGMDFGSVRADGPAVEAAQDADQGRDSTDTAAVAERCHTCSVVSFVADSQVFATDIMSPVVPTDRSPALVGFEQPATAPPPRV